MVYIRVSGYLTLSMWLLDRTQGRAARKRSITPDGRGSASEPAKGCKDDDVQDEQACVIRCHDHPLAPIGTACVVIAR